MARAPKKKPQAEPTPPAGYYRWLTVAGAALLLVWGGWWYASLRQPLPRLILGSPIGEPRGLTVIPSWAFVGLDFQHNYAGTTTWLAGENPYRAMSNDPMNAHYVYPPVTLAAFAWTRCFPPDTAMPLTLVQPEGETHIAYPVRAVLLWMGVAAAIIALAAWRSWRDRTELGLTPLPLVLLVAITLLSYPVMFELERGNCHTLPLLAALGVVGMLRWRTGWTADALAGLGVALAAGIKGFPGIMILGLFALRRFRAGFFAGAFLLALLAGLWPAFSAWLENLRELTAKESSNYFEYAHSLTMPWHLFWRDLHLAGIGAVPATPVVAAIVLGLAGFVSWRVFRSAQPLSIAWPFLLWLMASGTCVNKIAIDYGLIFLPLAVLALWTHRDRWWVQLIVGACALWCQPVNLGLGGAALLILKFSSICALGLLICVRAAEAKAPSAQAA